MRASWSLALLISLAACATSPRVGSTGSQKVLHVVLFWFKPDVDERSKQELGQAVIARMREVEGLEVTYAGRPAGTPRPLVDNSYGMLVIMRFKDREALAAWDAHPVHRDLIAKYGELVTKAVVYDAVE